MSDSFVARGEEYEEGSAVNLQSKRVREVFKYLPDWAPKTEDSTDHAAVLSPDVTLNAFCQLVALRLGVDRSLISFLDGEEQYVLAEGTKTSSLQRGRPTTVENELMTGLRTIASGQGLCYQALSQVPTDGILVVDNIHEHEHFCFRPFAQATPDVRFYAACPIVINGEKVGILCVIDKNPRTKFTSEEINFLSDISSAVAQHLESMRMRRTHTRSVDIVTALDAVMRPGQRNPSFRGSSSRKKKTTSKDQRQTKEEEGEAQAAKSSLSPQEGCTAAVEPNPPGTPLSLSSNFLEYAGNLLVDGFNGDGVIFYDAGSRVYTSSLSRRSNSHNSSSFEMPSTPLEPPPSFNFDESEATGSPACEILAFSQGRNPETTGGRLGILYEHNLRDLFESYPAGRIVHVGDAELPSMEQTDGSDDATSPFHAESLSKCLRTALPGAQSIVFFPLWDHYRERWYAGGFLYSTDAKRLMFSEDDLNFLRAFALVLTGELASRDRERSQNQKDAFISMISHELRTPLHGILSNVDLMRDIGLTTFQTILLDTISACGHSLMDIINHLIDRSTMVATDENFKKHHQLTAKKRRGPLKRATSYDKGEQVDLVILAEEVISALAIEMYLRTEARQGYEAALQSTNSADAQDLLPSHAVVVFDIHPQHNWFVKTSKGAFRRLLANLTSNAIKFTREGTIQISLQREDSTDESLTCVVTLKVEDTGEGISSDFLKHHLFEQFHQESSRTIGSGLGLYIVKSMVDELQGKIDVRSSKGNGTLVSITFPCELVEKNPNGNHEAITSYADPTLQQVKKEAHRLTACFVTAEDYGDARPAEQRAGLDHSRESLSRICRNWFGIKVEASSKLKAGPGIINFIDESFLDSRPLADALAEMMRDLKWTESGETFLSPVIIVGTVNFTAALQKQQEFEAKENMFSITNPCGPHQLARVLTSCMNVTLKDFNPEPTLPQIEKDMKDLNITEQQGSEQLRSDAPPQATAHILVASDTDKPILKQVDKKDRSMPSPVPSPWKKQPHILLVEDNAINMKVLERLCKRLSLTYALAFNGLEAVKLFEETPEAFDIIWMDIMMPVMDGLAATKQIRDIEQRCGRSHTKDRARVIALTGLSGEEIETEANHVGFDAFWTKPVKLDLLKKEVDQWAQSKDVLE